MSAPTPTAAPAKKISAKALAELRKDAARLDYLEAEANREPLLLHSGQSGLGYRGIGLANIGRSLRQAIDDMRRE
jgi:hypothetical protein